MKNLLTITFLFIAGLAFAQPVRTTITDDGVNVTISTPVNNRVVPICDFHWTFVDGQLQMWIEGRNELIPGGRLGNFTINGATTQATKLAALGAISAQCTGTGSGGGLDSIYYGNNLLVSGDTIPESAGAQTLTNTSDATSHTVTLSNSGGTFKLSEGSNITITTTGTPGDGIVTIASSSSAPTYINAPILPADSVLFKDVSNSNANSRSTLQAIIDLQQDSTTARNGVRIDAAKKIVLGDTYMVNQPAEFSAARKLNWGNFSNFIGSDSDSTFMNVDLSGKKLALKSLLTTSADFFSLTNNDYKIFQVSHNGSMELRSGLYDARWFQFVNNATFTNYRLGIGPYVNVTGNGAMGFGYSAVVSGANAIRIGNEGSATGSGSLSIGLSSTATQTNAQAFGAYIANAAATSTVLGHGRNTTKTLAGVTRYTGVGTNSELPVLQVGGYVANVLAGTWSRSNDTITWTGSMSLNPSIGQPYYFEQSSTVGDFAYVTQIISSTKYKIDRTITASSGTAIYGPETNGLLNVADGVSTSSRSFFRVGRKGDILAPDWVANPSLYSGTVSKYVAMDATGRLFPTDIPFAFYNVKNYGAVGDSATNDAAAIQAAIDAAELTGGRVFFPPGKYSFSSQLTINKKNVWLWGAGKGAVQLINRVSETTGTTVGIIIEGASGDTVENVVIQNLTIRGRADNSAAPYSHVFVDDFVRKTRFEDVEFKWCRQFGLRYSASIELPNTVIEGCDFEKIATNNMPRVAGAALSGAVSQMSVRNCNFLNVGDTLHYHAFYPDAVGFGYDLLLENTTFRGAYSNFNLSSGSNEIKGSIRILGNTFASGSSTNIWKLAYPLIEGNVFYNNQLRVENDPRIIGNSFIDTLGTLTYFINDEGNTDGGTVKSNTFLGASASTVGIDIDGTGSARWDISDNTFRNVGIAVQLASDSNIVERNIIYSNHDTTSIDLLSGSNVNIVRNNTIKSPNTVAIRNAGSGNTIKCNEFFGGASATASSPCVNTTDGTYTPTLTNTLNVGASTAYECNYLRVGNTVTVSGRVDIDAVATGSVILEMSLPPNHGSNFTAVEQAGGTFASTINTTGPINADVADDRLNFIYTASVTTNETFQFSVTYRIL